MPVIMHFSTFLKFLTLDTGDKIRQLENYAKPGGFDFYRPSRDAVLNYSAHGKSFKSVVQDIAKQAGQNTVGHNTEIFENVARWLDKQSEPALRHHAACGHPRKKDFLCTLNLRLA